MLGPQLREQLAADAYRSEALLPAMPWLQRTTPDLPRAVVEVDAAAKLITIEWPSQGSSVNSYLLRTRTRGVWSMQIVPRNETLKAISWKATPPDLIALSVIGRNGMESDPLVFSLSGS